MIITHCRPFHVQPLLPRPDALQPSRFDCPFARHEGKGTLLSPRGINLCTIAGHVRAIDAGDAPYRALPRFAAIWKWKEKARPRAPLR